MGIYTMIILLAAFIVPTALIEGTVGIWQRVKENAKYRRMGSI